MSILCGVMRVGLVAKGLLVKGDMDLELVLMCRDKPTKLLLYTVSANLPVQLQVCFHSSILHEQTNCNILKLMGWHIILKNVQFSNVSSEYHYFRSCSADLSLPPLLSVI